MITGLFASCGDGKVGDGEMNDGVSIRRLHDELDCFWVLLRDMIGGCIQHCQ